MYESLQHFFVSANPNNFSSKTNSHTIKKILETRSWYCTRLSHKTYTKTNKEIIIIIIIIIIINCAKNIYL